MTAKISNFFLTLIFAIDLSACPTDSHDDHTKTKTPSVSSCTIEKSGAWSSYPQANTIYFYVIEQSEGKLCCTSTLGLAISRLKRTFRLKRITLFGKKPKRVPPQAAQEMTYFSSDDKFAVYHKRGWSPLHYMQTPNLEWKAAMYFPGFSSNTFYSSANIHQSHQASSPD